VLDMACIAHGACQINGFVEFCSVFSFGEFREVGLLLTDDKPKPETFAKK
jgi:hypothetical protein